MRTLVALVFVVALAAAPASARANDAMLWACHGPDGRALPVSYDTAHSVGAFITPTSSVPCASPSDTIRLGFDNVNPPEGSFASLRFNPPGGGLTIDGVWLGRRVTGPGYFARTSDGDLETLAGAGTLDGVFAQAATGSWVELGLRCASAGCDMTGAALDFRFIALKVHDDLPPTLAVGNLPAYAAGVFQLTVDARDSGIGLARVTATVGGVSLASVALGQTSCNELSPGDATVDLPLNEDCPSARRLTLDLDSTRVADGIHPLEVTVTDGAGNATVHGLDLKVINHPPVSVTPAPTPTRTPAPTPTATPTPVPNIALLTTAKRYKVSKTGSLTAEASCPARAASNCSVALTLRAKLPGRRRTATIATARGSVQPGAKAKVKLQLSAAARRALAAKRSLSATLTLAGAKPVTVKLAR